MTLSGLGIAHVVIAPLVLGLAIIAALRLRTDRLFLMGFALLAGAFAVAALSFAWLACGLPVEAFRYVPLPLGLVACIALRGRFAAMFAADAPPRSPAASIAFYAALALVLVFAADHALRGSMMLALIGDEANIWASKADAIYVAGGLNEAFAQRLVGPPAMVHTDYPLLNPLLQMFTFATAGGLLQVGNRIPIFVCVVALLLLLASALRRAAGPWLAPALLLLVAGCDAIIEECENAASDGLVALGLLAAIECYARTRAQAQRGTGPVRPWLGAFAIALAFLAWSKNEGMMLAACVVVGVCVSEWRSASALGARRILAALVPCVMTVAAQLAFNARFGLHNDLIGDPDAPPFAQRVAAQAAHNAAAVARHAWEFVIERMQITNALPALCVALLILLPRVAWTKARAPAVAVCLGMAGFFAIYLGTPHEIDWHLRSSMERILFQLTPTCTLVVAILCREGRRE